MKINLDSKLALDILKKGRFIGEAKNGIKVFEVEGGCLGNLKTMVSFKDGKPYKLIHKATKITSTYPRITNLKPKVNSEQMRSLYTDASCRYSGIKDKTFSNIVNTKAINFFTGEQLEVNRSAVYGSLRLKGTGCVEEGCLKSYSAVTEKAGNITSSVESIHMDAPYLFDSFLAKNGNRIERIPTAEYHSVNGLFDTW